jgi:predicted component of type VI protein secretion system
MTRLAGLYRSPRLVPALLYHALSALSTMLEWLATCTHRVPIFIEIFQHNRQYDTLLPIIPFRRKLKAGIAY